MQRKILIINGPNLNLLGSREPAIYQNASYDDLLNYIKQFNNFSFSIDVKQTNHEGTIIDWLHEAAEQNYAAIIINAGAYSHYAYAIVDAIKAISLPVVEVHLTNIYEREPFRQVSLLTPVCQAIFYGKHFKSYGEAITFVMKGLENASI